MFDGAGKRVEAAWAEFNETLPVGSYRVEVALPTERPTVRQVLVTADEPVVIKVRPDPQLTQRLPASAGAILPDNGVSHPSEMFGAATTTHLGSLLAWAAWAAQFPVQGDGRKLRELGVERSPPDPGRCFVRLLVGDARPPGPNPQGGPIETLILDMNQQPVVMQPVPALVGFAVQWHAQVPSHTSLTVQTGGLNPRRIPLPFVADHVWTIVIVRESTQLTEIHRYLQRLETAVRRSTTQSVSSNRTGVLWKRAHRCTTARPSVCSRANLDPLCLAVLGYRLALENRVAGCRQKVVDRLKDVGLADVHVLASFVGERDKNMELALKSPSVPVVGEGYRLMEAWLVEHFAKQNMPPPLAPEPFTGGLWTTFDTRGQAVISKAFPVRNAPAWAAPLLPAADATARIESGPDRALHRDGLPDRTARTCVDRLRGGTEAAVRGVRREACCTSKRSSERQTTTATARWRGSSWQGTCR